MAAIALEECTGFDREGFMQYVAFNMAGRSQENLARTDTPLDAATHRHVLGHYVAFNAGFVAYYEPRRIDVAFDLSVNLNVTARRQRSGDHQIAADD
jgi:hypothetical protein